MLDDLVESKYKIDLVINTISLAEMSEKQIHDYSEKIKDMIGDDGICNAFMGEADVVVFIRVYGEAGSFLKGLGSMFTLAFGEFGSYDDVDSVLQEVLFSFATLALLLIMMNLLIGILSETLAQILENKERNEYISLCNIVLDIESFLILKWFEKEKEPQHIIWADYKDTGEEKKWGGKIKKTT